MAKYKVIVTARSFGNTDNKAQELLEEHGCEVKKLTAGTRTIEAQLEDEIMTADAVIAGLEEYSSELLRKAENLKIISRYGVGYDKIELKTAREQGIKVSITPGANGDAVADMALASMLTLARNIPVMDRDMKAKEQIRPVGIELWQKTVGIIGAGRIGQGVGKRCLGFAMRVLVYDTYVDENFKNESGAVYTTIDQILEEADFISIHLPLTDETKNMFSTGAFRKMKQNAILINTARGGIVDEEALYQALKKGEIRGAALDATIQEPPYESPLLQLDQCIITPHAGAATMEASSKMSYMAAQNVITVLEHGSCPYLVG